MRQSATTPYVSTRAVVHGIGMGRTYVRGHAVPPSFRSVRAWARATPSIDRTYRVCIVLAPSGTSSYEHVRAAMCTWRARRGKKAVAHVCGHLGVSCRPGEREERGTDGDEGKGAQRLPPFRRLVVGGLYSAPRVSGVSYGRRAYKDGWCACARYPAVSFSLARASCRARTASTTFHSLVIIRTVLRFSSDQCGARAM